jgi:hypothetical protein
MRCGLATYILWRILGEGKKRLFGRWSGYNATRQVARPSSSQASDRKGVLIYGRIQNDTLKDVAR